MFSAVKDFEPVVEQLIRVGISRPIDLVWILIDRPRVASESLISGMNTPKCSSQRRRSLLQKLRQQRTKETRKKLLSSICESALPRRGGSCVDDYTRRASAVYRISRFPAPRSEKQKYAWEEGKKAAKKGLALRERPTREVVIPHKHGQANDGDQIAFYYHLPPGATKDKPVPLVIILSGLDGYRTELAVWIEGWSQKNVAVIVLEIPGTGDSPAASNDPTSPERQWSSLFDWIDEQSEIDHSRRALWGFSTGGYYAIRLAHTHRDRLAGVVALGGGCHHMFAPEWLDNVNHLEYPFDLAHTLAYKWGYGDDLEKFKQEGMKFSLVEDGTLDKPCTRLLLVNGVGDE